MPTYGVSLTAPPPAESGLTEMAGGPAGPQGPQGIQGPAGPNLTTSAFGYTTGAGGTVTQATNKSTGVTLNKLTGAITTVPTVAPFERWYNGALRIAPGYNFSVQSSTATTLFCEYIFEVVDL